MDEKLYKLQHFDEIYSKENNIGNVLPAVFTLDFAE